MPPPSTVMQSLAPYLVLGTQLAASVVVMGALGWFVDRYAGSDPWGLIGGLTLGSVAGFYQFLKNVQRLLARDQETGRREQAVGTGSRNNNAE
ncbi:MAG: AtpZ/AtpI family protein [Candidatus Kapaibacteriota bacterium]|jgi:F0F1-type ATP synthase assembly protein I